MQKIRKIMALTLSMLMLAGMIPLSATAASFGDTGGHWAESVIDKWAGYGIVQGDDAGFRPNDSIKRGEFAVIVDRIMQYKTKAANVFADLSATEWYTDAALKLNAAGAMNGVGDASFDPTGFVTRQQAMVILARIFKVAPDSTSLYAFTDADQVASWAFAELGGMVKAGYVQGNDGKISPNANLTRAQAVQLFENIIKGFYNEAGTYSVTTDGVVIVNTPDVILQNSSTGKLFVTPGVGSGDFTLSKSTVKQLIVQGGGRNSINLEDSEVESLSVGVDSSTGALRVHSAGTTTIGAADVQSTSETITFTGDVGVIEVAAGSTVIVEGNVENLTIIGENVTVIVSDTASVANLDVQGSGASLDVSGSVQNANVTGGEAKVTLNETATVNNLAVEGGNASLDVAGKVASMDIKGGNTTVETKSTAQIDQVTINADNASIGGTGKVPEIKVEGGSGTEVKTEGSKVDVSENAGSVTTGDNAQIDPGTSGDSKGDTEQAGTGGGGSGNSSNQNNNTGNNNTGGGYVPVEPIKYEAQIDSTNYLTLAEAVEAVAPGETIKLLSNVTISSLNIDNFIIDLNGKALVTILSNTNPGPSIKSSVGGGSVNGVTLTQPITQPLTLVSAANNTVTLHNGNFNFVMNSGTSVSVTDTAWAFTSFSGALANPSDVNIMTFTGASLTFEGTTMLSSPAITGLTLSAGTAKLESTNPVTATQATALLACGLKVTGTSTKLQKQEMNIDTIVGTGGYYKLDNTSASVTLKAIAGNNIGYTILGNVSIDKNETIKASDTLTVGDGTIETRLTVPTSKKLTVELNGKLDVKGNAYVIPTGSGKIVIEKGGLFSDAGGSFTLDGYPCPVNVTVTASGSGLKYALTTSSDPVTVPAPLGLTVAENDTLCVGTGVTLNVTGTLTVNGTGQLLGGATLKISDASAQVDIYGKLLVEADSIIEFAGATGGKIILHDGAIIGCEANDDKGVIGTAVGESGAGGFYSKLSDGSNTTGATAGTLTIKSGTPGGAPGQELTVTDGQYTVATGTDHTIVFSTKGGGGGGGGG